MNVDSLTPAEEWLAKAAEDEQSIQVILKEAGAPSTACFLSQQMAEKCLKGLLVHFHEPFRKVHDLLELETLLLGKVPDIQELHAELQFLNRYYIETRYPGYQPVSEGESHQAFAGAQKIKKFVSRLLK